MEIKDAHLIAYNEHFDRRTSDASDTCCVDTALLSDRDRGGHAGEEHALATCGSGTANFVVVDTGMKQRGRFSL